MKVFFLIVVCVFFCRNALAENIEKIKVEYCNASFFLPDHVVDSDLEKACKSFCKKDQYCDRPHCIYAHDILDHGLCAYESENYNKYQNECERLSGSLYLNYESISPKVTRQVFKSYDLIGTLKKFNKKSYHYRHFKECRFLLNYNILQLPRDDNNCSGRVCKKKTCDLLHGGIDYIGYSLSANCNQVFYHHNRFTEEKLKPSEIFINKKEQQRFCNNLEACSVVIEDILIKIGKLQRQLPSNLPPQNNNSSIVISD